MTNNNLLTWESIKQRGSAHYKNGKIEPIDLYKSLPLHPSLNCLEAKALTDCIKYAHRMLTKGVNLSDCEKIKHYTDMVIVCIKERGKDENP